MASILRLAPTPIDPVVPTAISGQIGVVLAEDHEPMRRSLRLLLDSEQDLEVLAEAGDHKTVVHQVHDCRPQVLVLDLRMAGNSSLDAVRTLSERAPATRIVVISMEDNPVFAQRALTAGAVGYVAKDLADAELPQAIRAAAADQEFISPRVAARLNELHRALTDHKLTQREVEVLRLIAFGHTSVEIARKLQLSPRTIETHRAHIHKKLGLTTRAELVRYALRRGLIGA
jgi:two-component system response regulator NreC